MSNVLPAEVGTGPGNADDGDLGGGRCEGEIALPVFPPTRRVANFPQASEFSHLGGIEEFEMDRRSFMMGLLAVASGGSATLVALEAAAAPATPGACELPLAGSPDQMSSPSEGLPLEYAQYRGRPTHWHHRDRRYRHHRRHVRRRHVCRWHRDRWGRRVRRCHWVWI